MTVDELPPYYYECERCKESDGFEAWCHEIPDLRAYGETEDEALFEIETAVCAWLEVLQGERIPFPEAKILNMMNKLEVSAEPTNPNGPVYNFPIDVMQVNYA